MGKMGRIGIILVELGWAFGERMSFIQEYLLWAKYRTIWNITYHMDNMERDWVLESENTK